LVERHGGSQVATYVPLRSIHHLPLTDDAPALAVEIEKTLKRVEEGIETYDAMNERYEQGIDSGRLVGVFKSKAESALKHDVRKLQHDRDQIRVWEQQGGPTIVKLEAALQGGRLAIEERMTSFKVLEHKVRAFSNEGLSAGTVLTPEERQKGAARLWMQQFVERLEDEAELAEAELEAMGSGDKKRKGGKIADAASSAVARFIDTHRFHAEKLDALTRLLDNDAVTPDQVDALKDEVEYYLQNAREPDFECDRDVYVDLIAEAVEAPPLAAAAVEKEVEDTGDDVEKDEETDEAAVRAAATAAAKARIAAAAATAEHAPPAKPAATGKGTLTGAALGLGVPSVGWTQPKPQTAADEQAQGQKPAPYAVIARAGFRVPQHPEWWPAAPPAPAHVTPTALPPVSSPVLPPAAQSLAHYTQPDLSQPGALFQRGEEASRASSPASFAGIEPLPRWTGTRTAVPPSVTGTDVPRDDIGWFQSCEQLVSYSTRNSEVRSMLLFDNYTDRILPMVQHVDTYVEQLTKGAEMSEDSEKLAVAVSAVLRNISFGPVHVLDGLVAEEAHVICADLMDDFPGNGAIACNGAWMLANLAVGDDEAAESRRQSVTEVDGERAILAALDAFMQDAGTTAQCCRAIANLASDSSASAHARRDTVATWNGAELVVRALLSLDKYSHVSAPHVMVWACRALAALSNGKIDIREAIVATEGVAAIVAALNRFLDDAVAAEAACLALGSLAEGPTAVKDAIVHADGVVAIVAAMRLHAGVGSIAVAGCRVLLELSRGAYADERLEAITQCDGPRAVDETIAALAHATRDATKILRIH